MKTLCLICLAAVAASAQEAPAGLEVRSTVTAGTAITDRIPGGDPESGGFRALFYPTLKLDEHWAITGAVQVHSRPYFLGEIGGTSYGVTTDILQLNLNYSRFWKKRSIVARVGQLSTAFGSFMLRYDDAANAMVDIPQAYGYYSNVTTKGLTGAQVDVVLDKVDLRAQFTNSSPGNPRSIFDKDQYGDWTGGAGYTIRQGLRVGVSAYRGPYLDRHYAFFFPGEAPPRTQPGTAFGADVQWGQGPWNVNGEWQYFHFDYTRIPTFTTHTGYAEIKRTLHPRVYVATRLSYLRANAYPGPNSYEVAVGYRPNSRQLIKVEYEHQNSNTLAVQIVTTLKPLAFAWR